MEKQLIENFNVKYSPFLEAQSTENVDKQSPSELVLLEENVEKLKCEQHFYIIECTNCKHTQHIFASIKTIITYRSSCYKCANIESQSFLDTVIITDCIVGIGTALQSIISQDAVLDMATRGLVVRNWLMYGQHVGESFCKSIFKIPDQMDPYVNLFEDIVIFMHDFLSAKNMLGRWKAIIVFCKLRGSRFGFSSVLLYTCSDILGCTLKEAYTDKREKDKLYKDLEQHVLGELDLTPQDDEYDNIFAKARGYLNMFDKLKETTLYKKCYKLSLYFLASGILDNTRFSFEDQGFSRLEKDTILRTHKPGVSMFHCMLDTALFLCDRGYLYLTTKDPAVIMQSGGKFERWLSVAHKQIRDAQFLNNPEPHGINKFQYLSDLKDNIEKGRSIVKYTAGLDKSEKLCLQKTLNDLLLIESRELTKREALKPRKEPFAVMIHGSSSICKSQLKQILFYHYAKIFKLPTSPEFMFTHNPTANFWDNYNSSQHTIVMDDVAFLLPNGELDPTLKEMLQIINSVPYTPDQAALEDKGRTPVRAEHVIGTTNTKDLNLHAYFACPFAIARRWKYTVTAEIKPEYSKCGIMADSKRIPVTPEGDYMNIWNFKIYCPIPVSTLAIDKMNTQYVLLEKFTDIHDFLAWYIKVAKEHEVSQAKALAAERTMSDIVVCEKCYRAQNHCRCVQEQSSIHDILDLTPRPRSPIQIERDDDPFAFFSAAPDIPLDDGNRETTIMRPRLADQWIRGRTIVHENDTAYQNLITETHISSNRPRLEPIDVEALSNAAMQHVQSEILDSSIRFDQNFPSVRPPRIAGPTYYQPSGPFSPLPQIVLNTLGEEEEEEEKVEEPVINRDFWDTYGVPTVEEQNFSSSWSEPEIFTMDDLENLSGSAPNFDDTIFDNDPLDDAPIPTYKGDVYQAELDLINRSNSGMKIKLWYYNNVIKGNIIEYDFLQTIRFYMDIYRFQCCLIFFTFLSFAPSVITLFGLIFLILFISRYFWKILGCYYQYKYGTLWRFRLCARLFKNEYSMYRHIMHLSAIRIKWAFTSYQLKILSGFLSTAAVTTALFTAYKMYMNRSDKDLEMQGNVGTVPVAREVEKPVFYYNDTYASADMDISSTSRCQGKDLISKINRNIARFEFQFDENPGKVNATQAINIAGNIWIVNTHSLKYDSGSLRIIFDPKTQNISRNTSSIKLTPNMIYKLEGTDISFIEIRNIAPGCSLIEYFSEKKQLTGIQKGVTTVFDIDGTRSDIIVDAIHAKNCGIFHVPAYYGYVKKDTIKGQCGAPLIISIGDASIIAGIHGAGGKNIIVSQFVSQQMLRKGLQHFRPQIYSGEIILDAPGYKREIKEVHPKSNLRFVPQGTATIIGSFDGYRPKHKSKVTKTYIHDAVIEDGYVDDYGQPDMTWKPWSLAIEPMTNPNHMIDSSILKECVDAFSNDIKMALRDQLHTLEVYTQDVALNGADGITYVDRLNINTSAGNPFKKSKKNFVTLDENNKIVKLHKLVQDRIDHIEKCYDSGKRAHPQFCAHIKDEALPIRKIKCGKSRIFTGAEFAWSVVMRRYMLSFIRLIQNNPYVFESMPGVVAQGPEWKQLYDYIIKHGLDKIIAGDYGSFDKKMAALFIGGAFDILINLAKEAGWSDKDVIVLQCIAADTAHFTVDFNGDLLEVQGNPSGHPLTVIINCLVNCLYMRYAFSLISGMKVKDFKKYVNLATYGDDNIMSVSDECPNFNHTNIAKALATIGVEYTMAEKGAESIPYVHILQTTFLKRQFRFDPDVGCIVAPLDELSIHKMLTNYVKNDTLCPEAHSIAVIETAIREYFFYGKKRFEDRSNYFRLLVDKMQLQPYVKESTFPSYEQLKKDYWDKKPYDMLVIPSDLLD
jgi:ribosomal protein S27E